ncbi:urease accessory protein UreD [Notoacmeibacter sp. MSK16QG-6]|uniref:urease accessory protein UreD n=1 Tax=Notoacmeibacter sp. MSK16QG-6 TaxID=2957982 RepID=UPI00209F0D07|nr:urease accessory protein UreD [Notoacmeibacter sp. MSK16QG-6]MCP1200412.1 urease accessory protein UreD [Notoacmeibacter sp. MSK16QG-6]
MTALPTAQQFDTVQPLATSRMQRSTGCGRIAAKPGRNGETRLGSLFQEGSARIRLPKSHSNGRLEAVLLNTSGGMTDGDRLQWSADAGANTHLTLASQTAERLYRAPTGTAEVDVRLSVKSDATLHWLPQETIMFDGGALRRTITADLAQNAELLICEPIVFGRAAMGETVRQGRLRDDWRIRRDGRLIHAEAFRLDGAVEEKLARESVASGCRAAATAVLFTPRAEALLDRVREIICGSGGASLFEDKLVCRLLAADALALRRKLIPLLITLRGGHDLPRCWYC